ncbi:MAG: T9SS type A sorting domain-containing protein [Saprospiraceae bacterium]|jgi:hypothetical protein
MNIFNKSGILFLLAIIGIASTFSFKLDPKNPPTGQTGAPSETTCSTASGCHSGGTYTGTVALTGLPDQILPSTAYNVTVTLTSTCSRTGFELTVLDKSNAKCGTLTAGTNNNIKTAGTREYARQTNPNTMSGGKSSYAFKWTSPASITGDSAIFYYVMLQANGDGGKSGDNVAKGKKTVGLIKTSATDETLDIDLKIYPNPTSDFVTIHQNNDEALNVTCTNSAGKQLLSFDMDRTKTLDVRNLSAGQYFLQFRQGHQTVTKTISIVK